MPREQTRQVNRLEVATNAGPRADFAVMASPTARAERASMSPEVEGLMRGLSSMNSALRAGEADREQTAANERSGGRDFAKSGGKAEDAQSRGKSFLEGYTEGSGEASAIADAQELAARYQSDVDKQETDISQFVGQFYNDKMKGNQDPVFRRGYDRIFAAEAMQLRSKHGEGLAVAIVDKKRADAQRRIDFTYNQRRLKGEPVGEEFLAQISAIGDDARLTGRERDDSLFLTLKQYSDGGDDTVWAVAKLPRKDSKTGNPMPALYDNPHWKEKIDAAEKQAKATWLAGKKRASQEEKDDRENRQNEALGVLIQKGMAGDIEGATAEANKLLQNRTLFTRQDDIVNALALFKKGTDLVEKPGEAEAENAHLIGIYEGKLSKPSQIANLQDVGVMGKRRLISSLNSYTAQQQTLANSARSARAAEAANANNWTRNPQFKASTDFLKDQLRPAKGPLSDFTQSDISERAAQSMAEREFINWMASNPTADDTTINQKSTEIVKRYRDARSPDDAQGTIARMGIPYRNMRELYAAKDSIDPQTYQMFRSVLMPLETKGNKK